MPMPSLESGPRPVRGMATMTLVGACLFGGIACYSGQRSHYGSLARA